MKRARWILPLTIILACVSVIGIRHFLTSKTDAETIAIASTGSAADTASEALDLVLHVEPLNLADESASSFEAEGDSSLADNSPADSHPPREITLMAVGDNLMHMGVIRAGDQEDGSLDYSFLFTGIEDFLDSTDIKVINQETILGGNHRGFSGYPFFNSPTEVGDAITDAGFNVVLHASNHAADQQIGGLLDCVDYWATQSEVLMAGITEESFKEHTLDNPDYFGENIPLLTIKDTTFAILNYTYSPNTEVLPSKIQGHLNILCDYDKKTGQLDFTTLHPQVLADIAVAEEIADVVIVFPHWGTEYTTKPSKYQTKWATQMTEAGADLIIGTHPHVVEPVEWITASNGNRALCFYSLGNYISTQKEPLCMLEAMAYVTFREAEDGTMQIVSDESGAIPMVCQYKSNPVRAQGVYFLEDYNEELAASHGILDYGGKALYYDDLKQWAAEILGDFTLDKSILNSTDSAN